MVKANDDVDSLQRHIGGETAFPYVDFQERRAVAEALERWPLLRAYAQLPDQADAVAAGGVPAR